LNWNAFLWGAFWALAYGIYAWFWALFAVRTASVVFFTLVNRMNPTPSGTSMTVMVVAWAVLNLGLSALLGFKANRLLWERRGRIGQHRTAYPGHEVSGDAATVGPFRHHLQHGGVWGRISGRDGLDI